MAVDVAAPLETTPSTRRTRTDASRPGTVPLITSGSLVRIQPRPYSNPSAFGLLRALTNINACINRGEHERMAVDVEPSIAPIPKTGRTVTDVSRPSTVPPQAPQS